MKRLAALLAGMLLLSGCTGDDLPDTPPTTYSTLGVAGEVMCGFVPKAPLVTAIGGRDLRTKGSLEGRDGGEPLSLATCLAFADGREFPNLDVMVRKRGRDGAFVEWQMRRPESAWTLFPAGDAYGYAKPEYEHTADGQPRTGAVAQAVYGDWYINLKLYAPAKGRDPVKDSIDLVDQVIAALQLPKEPSRDYPDWTPEPTTPTPTR